MYSWRLTRLGNLAWCPIHAIINSNEKLPSTWHKTDNMKKSYNDHYKTYVSIPVENRDGLPLVYKFLYYFRFRTRKKENIKTPLISVKAYNTGKAIADASYKPISSIIDLNLLFKDHEK
jgi:hypothetical protein